VASHKRGLWLAARLGASKALFQECCARVLKATESAMTDTEGFRFHALMTLLLETRQIDRAAEFAALADQFAQRLQGTGNFHAARSYWEIAAEWQKRNKDWEAEKHARHSAAECYVQEAETRTKDAQPSYLSASLILAQGIEALRQAGGDSGRVKELKQRLVEYQKKSISEMKTASAEVDVAELVEKAREHVELSDLRQALFKFAMIQRLTDLKVLRESILDAARRYPMSHVFQTWVVDQQGRPKATKAGLLDLSGGRVRATRGAGNVCACCTIPLANQSECFY
jgi:hypothetical protein